MLTYDSCFMLMMVAGYIDVIMYFCLKSCLSFGWHM